MTHTALLSLFFMLAPCPPTSWSAPRCTTPIHKQPQKIKSVYLTFLNTEQPSKHGCDAS